MAKAKHLGVYDVHQDVHVDHDGPPRELEDGTVTGRYELDFPKGRHTAKDPTEQHALEHLAHIDDHRPEKDRQPLATLVEPAVVEEVEEPEDGSESAPAARRPRRRGGETE